MNHKKIDKMKQNKLTKFDKIIRKIHYKKYPTNSKKQKDKANRAKSKSKSKKAGGNSHGGSNKGGKGKCAVRR